MRKCLIKGLLFCSLSGIAWGAPPIVYKYIGPDGRITYSATPPAEGTATRVESVKIAPPPTAAQLREAQERLQRLENSTQEDEVALAAQQQNRQNHLAAAEQELMAAREALEKAKVKTPADWQPLVNGRRVLKQSYFDRVEQAEARVKAAETAWKKAKRSR